ncbi:hypothetical protein Ade02nite_35010 [Paractinoplanes deccanensis]|uniref:Uncharacterized protein n=1 Tax=Paractinoplanes deccanensis TaxID=113561 RepID=A0ABQ3Y4E4_9ACTN|nr:hypothetical protein Ade02nite_35010 [Actinoplanes deccanensis]
MVPAEKRRAWSLRKSAGRGSPRKSAGRGFPRKSAECDPPRKSDAGRGRQDSSVRFWSAVTLACTRADASAAAAEV